MFGWFLIGLECRLRTVVMQGGSDCQSDPYFLLRADPIGKTPR
jgi:hypothetical protein